MKTRLLVPLAIIIIGLVFATMMIISKKPPQKKTLIIQPRAVKTITAQAQDIQFKVASQGVVQSKIQSNLVSQVSGVVKYIAPNFVTGGFFKKDDVLLQIDDTDYQIAINESQSRLDGDQARLSQEKARVQQAEQEWALTGRPKSAAPALALRLPYLEEAEAKVRGSEADLANAKLRLQRTTLRAPYDGILAAKQVDLGQYVNTGNQLAQLFSVDVAEVRLSLSDKDMAFLQLPEPGHEDHPKPLVTFSASVSGQDYQWQGKIIRTEGVVDANTREHYAVAEIEDPYNLKSHSAKPALSVGTFVKAQIEGKLTPSLVKLPREVLKDSNIILINDNNQLRIRHVQLIRSEADWIYLGEGVQSGEKVITTSLETRIEGMALKDDTEIHATELTEPTQVVEKLKHLPTATTSSVSE